MRPGALSRTDRRLGTHHLSRLFPDPGFAPRFLAGPGREAWIASHQAGLVVDQAGREAEDRGGVVVLLAAGRAAVATAADAGQS